MSKGDNSPGVSKLAKVMKGVAKDAQDTTPVLDFGVIQANGGLLTNRFPIPIPKEDYVICRHLKSRNVSATTTSASVGDHGSHSHRVTIGTREALDKGDRVLVAWVDDDAVVIDVILNADSVL